MRFVAEAETVFVCVISILSPRASLAARFGVPVFTVAAVPVLYAEPRRRSTAPGCYGLASVDCGVEVGVVVHLELTVKLEAAEAGGGVVEEGFETAGEVGGLLLEDDEAVGVAEAMGVGGGVTMGLDAGVEDAEGEDGEAIDDEAGCLGVERGGGVLRGEIVEEPEVDLFDEIVAALVEAVDGTLDAGDVGIGGLGIAGLVLFVP